MTTNNYLSIIQSQKLSATQLFEILQEEYIVCELRFKIYPHEKHREYWMDLMEKKKEKIIDIAQKKSLLSIFDDKRIKAEFEKRIIPEIGFPKFIYKNDAQRLLQEKWDIHNYFLRDTKVKVYFEGEMQTGVIQIVDLSNRKISIFLDKNKKVKEFAIELITRIL